MRVWFGAGIADYVINDATVADTGGVNKQVAVFEPGAIITFWTAQTGGTQYTDLLDATGVTIATVTADTNGSISARFQGPDGAPFGPAAMWASANDGPRVLMFGDLTGVILQNAADLAQAQTDIAAAVAAAAGVYPDIEFAGGAWPTRPVTARRASWWGPTAPTIGGNYAADGDLWYPVAARP